MSVGADLRVVCTKLGDALKIDGTDEQQMGVQLCHEKLDKSLQAAGSADRLQEAQEQMGDLGPMIIALCEDPTISGLVAEDIREQCQKAVETLQREAIKGNEFEKEMIWGLSAEENSDDIATAEIAARKIQALYRGRAGRLITQKQREGSTNAHGDQYQKRLAIEQRKEASWSEAKNRFLDSFLAQSDSCAESSSGVEALEHSGLTTVESRHNPAESPHVSFESRHNPAEIRHDSFEECRPPARILPEADTLNGICEVATFEAVYKTPHTTEPFRAGCNDLRALYRKAIGCTFSLSDGFALER